MAEFIVFDQTIADTLIQVADRLQSQAGERSNAAEIGLTDFAGGYARLFTEACAAEAEDRGRLAGLLADLADSVRDAKLRATEEKERLEQVAIWREARASGSFFSEGRFVGFMPPQPSLRPILSPHLQVNFAVQQRVRIPTGTSTWGSITSARPDNLRSCVSLSRTANNVLTDEYDAVSQAISNYNNLCSWAAIDASNFLPGFADRKS